MPWDISGWNVKPTMSWPSSRLHRCLGAVRVAQEKPGVVVLQYFLLSSLNEPGFSHHRDSAPGNHTVRCGEAGRAGRAGDAQGERSGTRLGSPCTPGSAFIPPHALHGPFLPPQGHSRVSPLPARSVCPASHHSRCVPRMVTARISLKGRNVFPGIS